MNHMKRKCVICHKKIQAFCQVIDSETKKKQMKIIAQLSYRVLQLNQEEYSETLKVLVQKTR